MKLKKIEMQGFKSFADKIEIQFKDGITAIVGPNGSGKSNISDAVRWVLGEQSVKTLRGSKMEDIIFSGTGKRKPLGYTEVTITFDNRSSKIPIDYEEVAVTRRMFRSGESEYYLNKNSCRLRDIRELFMDTGVGKDGYSIVGQGRIDEILSNRPEDRRNIFEEAAGIVKFKTKKEEAERKLEKTEGNILRIKDIVHELSSQAEILEVQSQKASTFSKLFNRLRDLEVNLFLKDIKEGNSLIEEINKEILKTEESLKVERENKESIDESFNQLKINIDKLDIEIEDYRNREMSTKNKIDESRNKKILLEEKKGFNLRDLKRLEDERRDLKNKLEGLDKGEVSLKEKINSFEEECRDLLSKYSSQAVKLEEKGKSLDATEELIEFKKNNIIEIYNRSSDHRSELNSINSFNENIEKRTAQLRKEIDEMIGEKDKQLKEYKSLLNSEEELRESLSKAKDKFSDLKNIEYKNTNHEEMLNKKINTSNIELQDKLSSLKLFKNMEKSYEGYYGGVKSILRGAKSNEKLKKGLLGVVAELLRVDEKYEKAIDIALGARAQNIVTPTEEDAKTIIEYLKKNKQGRITCLPLNVIRGNTINLSPREREEFKILGLGSEVIDYDEKYGEIFKSLLGRTIIIENMDYGIKLANKYNHSYRIVTLSGEVLNPGGSMTGGSYSSNSVSIINRKNRIEKLEKEIKEYKGIQDSLLKEKDLVLNNLSINRANIKELEEVMKNLEYKIINTQNQKENKKLESSRLDERVEKSEKEIKTLNLELDNYNLKKEELKHILKKLEKESASLKEEVKELTMVFNKGKSSREELGQLVTDMKIDLNKKENEIKNLRDRLNNNIFDIREFNDQIKEKEESILLNNQELEKIEESNIELSKKIEELDIVKIKLKEKLEKSIKEKRKLMEDFYSQQDNLKLINEKITDLDKVKNAREVKLAKVSIKLENYHKRLEDDYELNYEEALKYEKEIENIQETIIETRRLKVEIKGLGTVNLSSIEEYKKLKTRLDFILDQQNDLIKAKEDLKEVILDMEGKMEKQFLESFKQINENFQEIFKILFDGGKAELFLDNQEDVLNTGIEIKAQPPGKRLQSLSLLSGGEKSLTAVALLFSILKMKPAPFCVLDEIDAALDEANIGRYTNYLKTYCADTQFIMITHRKTTMEMADVLYGVTMEEEGISKLISVEIKDNMDEIAS